MPPEKITGYAAMAEGAPLTPFTYDKPQLKANEVRIAVTHCGLCGTDIQGIDNYYGIVDYPFVPGHEIVGTISEVGKAVSTTRLGQRVGVGWQGRACGQCEWMVSILKKRGKLVLSGFPDLNLDSVDLVAHELSIEGSFLGTQQDMRDMLRFAQAQNIQPMLETMPLSQINQAIERLKRGQARYRIVLVNDF